MDLPDLPPTFREKSEANQARANLLREERMLRKEQKPLWVRYLPEFLFWAATISALYAFGALNIWPLREMRLIKEKERASFSSASVYHTAHAQYLEGEIQQAAVTLLPVLKKHPDSYPGNILMARIELARHQPAAALKYLEAARETALDRREINDWVTDIKSRLPAP